MTQKNEVPKTKKTHTGEFLHLDNWTDLRPDFYTFDSEECATSDGSSMSQNDNELQMTKKINGDTKDDETIIEESSNTSSTLQKSSSKNENKSISTTSDSTESDGELDSKNPLIFRWRQFSFLAARLVILFVLNVKLFFKSILHVFVDFFFKNVENKICRNSKVK